MMRDAWLSDNELYRYTLDRVWFRREFSEEKIIGWVMLNPSKADANVDDSTIKRCIAYSQNWGYDGMRVVNLFALRATDPKDMRAVADHVGPDNDKAIAMLAQLAEKIVVAWGEPKWVFVRERVEKVCEILVRRNLYCLETTKKGQPRHPLYLDGELELKLWRQAGSAPTVDSEYR